jgi:polyphosphate kinase
MEVQARFDEESNLYWADRLEAAGVRSLYSMRGLKVHAKVALVVRAGAEGLERYARTSERATSTRRRPANLHGSRHLHVRPARRPQRSSRCSSSSAATVAEPTTEHLLVAPFTLRDGFDRLIEHEAQRAKAGRPSGITLKMNALEDPKIIRRLCDASVAGVPIDIVVQRDLPPDPRRTGPERDHPRAQHPGSGTSSMGASIVSITTARSGCTWRPPIG